MISKPDNLADSDRFSVVVLLEAEFNFGNILEEFNLV